MSNRVGDNGPPSVSPFFLDPSSFHVYCHCTSWPSKSGHWAADWQLAELLPATVIRGQPVDSGSSHQGPKKMVWVLESPKSSEEGKKLFSEEESII